MPTDLKKLFTRTLPAAIAKRPPADTLGVRYSFKISGEGGGEWFIENPNKLAARSTSRGTVHISVADFDLLMENPQHNGRKLLDAGKIKLSGDLTKQQFDQLLALLR